MSHNALKTLTIKSEKNLTSVVIVSLIQSTKSVQVDLSGLQGFAPAGGLPAEILNVMALCGVGSAVTIITTAIGIRLALQLIPFTRLGS